MCFGRIITTQFDFITRTWSTNDNFPFPDARPDALHAFENHVLEGGYFFVPPLQREDQPWSWILPS